MQILYNKIMNNTNFSHCMLMSSEKLGSSSKRFSSMFILVFILLILKTSSIIPSRPIIVSPNTQSSPSNFIFNFYLDQRLESTGYLMITFTPLISTAIPSTCMVINSTSSLVVNTCVNLNADSIAIPSILTVNQTWITNINPNIDATKTVVLQFNQALLANIQYSIQIITNNVLPAIGSITSNFQMYTISGTGFMIEQNWNFGQVFFEYRQNNILNVNSINDLTQNLPGTLTSNLQFDITIGVQVPTPYSCLKFILSNSFQFSASSLVRVQGLLSSAPQKISTQIISPNIILVTFNESFAPLRKFQIIITDISNPLQITSGFVSVYSLPYNSMSPLQIKQLAIPIATTRYAPTVTVLTAEGITQSSPVQFYQLKEQYITVVIILPSRACDSNFVIQIKTDSLTIYQGTAYAQTSTVLASTLKYDYYTSSGVRISGFPTIPSGSTITVTFKVSITSTPTFNIAVSIDTLASISNPIMLGNAAATTTVVANNYISLLTGNQLQTNKLTMMPDTTSLIQFTVTPTFLTQSGSILKIFTCQQVTQSIAFDPTTSCLVNGVATVCSIVTNLTLTVITISSTSSGNLFVTNAATTVVINNVQFLFPSSNTNYIYQFYFQLTNSVSSSNPIIMSTLITPLVIPKRNLLAGFANYFSNTVYSTGSNYPNIFRVVSTTPASWNYVIQSTEKRIITVFAMQKWTKLFTTLNSGDAYPVLSSMSGVTATYVQGSTTNVNIDCPLDWDRVHLILPGSEVTTTLSISLPLTYTTQTIYHFEIMMGIYNTQTRMITYKYIEPMPVFGAPTYLSLSALVSMGSLPLQSGSKIQLAGQAGSYQNNVSITVSPTGTYSASSYSSGLIIMSTWNWFDSTSSYNLWSTSNVNPVYANNQQIPLSLKLGSSSYLTFIPFKTAGVYASLFNITLDQIKLPYTTDLPYYSIVLVDGTGAVDSYYQYINQDHGVFYYTVLNYISFSCRDNSIGVTNTDCSIGFIPNQQIDIQSTIYVQLTGLQVSTSSCTLVRNVDSYKVPLSCASSIDKTQLIVSLQNSNRLLNLTQYTLTIYGVSINTGTNIQYASVSIRESSGSYVIESADKILTTTVSSYFPIYIDQMNYLKNNPIVVSGFIIYFSLPRQLNLDQVFAVVMSNDLSNLNNVACRLKIKLFYQTNNSEITQVRWYLNTKNYQIIFQDLHSYLGPFSYRLQIYGLTTPSLISQSIISLIYLRTYDNSYTIQNTLLSTATFPPLVEKINSLISMQSYFNTQGDEQPLSFNITNQFAEMNAQTVWYITFPRYYSQDIWNQNYLAFCSIDGIKLNCALDQNLPYTIKITNSPKIIPIGQIYTILIAGIDCPRANYLNGNPLYVTENIFFAVAVNDSAPSFVQYSELFMTQTIINPQQTAGYGTVTVTSIASSNAQTRQTTFFTIQLKCSVLISANDWIFITFPEGFDNFNDISMTGNIVYLGLQQTFTATTVNRRIGFKVLAPITSIAINSVFTIQISSLPTPKSVVTLNMNELKIVVTPLNMISTKASSLQLHNQVATQSFNSSELLLVINNFNVISLTAGTYSNPIKIASSDGTAFLSNIKVQFISSDLTFLPAIASLMLGNTNGEFKIGTASTLIPTHYTFSIIKRQTSISAFYTALSMYTVLVQNLPVLITIPSTVTVPRGGCSIPFKITLPNAPYQDLSMTLNYDSASYTLDQFWINYQMCYNELEFTSSITSRWLSFCVASDFAVSTLPVSLQLGGTNQNSYSLSTTSITVNIIANTTTALTPTLTMAVVNTQKTYARINVTTNMKGLIYYELKLSPLSYPMSLINLKYQIKKNNVIVESQTDFLNQQIYTDDRDHRINLMTVTPGLNNLEFQNLLPQRTYTICVYFQNQHGNYTSQICNNFAMQTWGVTKKVFIQFTQAIFQSDLNNLLCYFSKASNSKITQIVDLQGKSCSLNTSASNYNFNYNGSMSTNELKSTIIYHISDMNLTTDPSSSSFAALYDANGITNTSKAMALANFSINYISKSTFIGSYNPIDMIKMTSGQFIPILTFTVESYIRSSNKLRLLNLQLSYPGSVYLILTAFKQMSKDQITGNSIIQIRPLVTPTYEQILNCQDGYNTVPLDCQKIVLKQGQSLNVEFTNIAQNRKYAVYYIVANEYPLRPVVFGDVMVKQMLTLVLMATKMSTFVVGIVTLITIILTF